MILGHLLGSASMDGTVKVWNPFQSVNSAVSINFHTEGVKDFQWNWDGTKILSGGFDKHLIITDVASGKLIQVKSSFL